MRMAKIKPLLRQARSRLRADRTPVSRSHRPTHHQHTASQCMDSTHAPHGCSAESSRPGLPECEEDTGGERDTVAEHACAVHS